MAMREFTDSSGTLWTVWDVPPHRVFERARSGVERRAMDTPGYTPERRQRPDRRRRVTSPQLQGGWVCFAAGSRKRRLYPPPAEWASASDAELEALCGRAEDGPPMRVALPEPG